MTNIISLINGYSCSLVKREVQEIRLPCINSILKFQPFLTYLSGKRCDGVRLLKAYVMFSSNIKTFLAFCVFHVSCPFPYFNVLFQ